jgi:hypothetical protein
VLGAASTSRFSQVQVSGHVFGFEVTPDLKYYTYSSPRYASDLYIVNNLH